ncbi:MAG: YbfB/YjiJ family MFS transporter [Pseudomonadota bacterium]
MPASPAPAVSDAQRLRVLFAGICALVLTVGLARFAYTPMLPVMHREAGLTDLAAGWLATFNYAGYITGAMIAASVGNPQQKFVMYRVGLVLAVVTTAALGLTDNTTLWAVLRFVSGLSSTAGLLLASGLALNWLMRNGFRPELGLHFTGLGLGIVVSGLAVAAMSGWLNWAQQWFGLGLLGLVFFVPAWLWLPRPAPAAPLRAAGAHAQAATPDRRWLWLMVAMYFCAGFGYVISATFIVAILVKLPLLADHGGWVWVIVGAAAVPSSFAWDRIARARGEIAALLLAFALQTVSILLPALTTNAALNLLGAVLYGSTFVGIVSLTLTLIGRHFPDNPAKAMARLTLSYGVSQMAAPAMAGFIAARTGSYHGALYVTAAVMLAGMALLGVMQLDTIRDRRR